MSKNTYIIIILFTLTSLNPLDTVLKAIQETSTFLQQDGGLVAQVEDAATFLAEHSDGQLQELAQQTQRAIQIARTSAGHIDRAFAAGAAAVRAVAPTWHTLTHIPRGSDDIGNACFTCGMYYLETKPRNIHSQWVYTKDDWIAATSFMLQAVHHGRPAAMKYLAFLLFQANFEYTHPWFRSPQPFDEHRPRPHVIEYHTGEDVLHGFSVEAAKTSSLGILCECATARVAGATECREAVEWAYEAAWTDIGDDDVAQALAEEQNIRIHRVQARLFELLPIRRRAIWQDDGPTPDHSLLTRARVVGIAPEPLAAVEPRPAASRVASAEIIRITQEAMGSWQARRPAPDIIDPIVAEDMKRFERLKMMMQLAASSPVDHETLQYAVNIARGILAPHLTRDNELLNQLQDLNLLDCFVSLQITLHKTGKTPEEQKEMIIRLFSSINTFKEVHCATMNKKELERIDIKLRIEHQYKQRQLKSLLQLMSESEQSLVPAMIEDMIFSGEFTANYYHPIIGCQALYDPGTNKVVMEILTNEAPPAEKIIALDLFNIEQRARRLILNDLIKALDITLEMFRRNTHQLDDHHRWIASLEEIESAPIKKINGIDMIVQEGGDRGIKETVSYKTVKNIIDVAKLNHEVIVEIARSSAKGVFSSHGLHLEEEDGECKIIRPDGRLLTATYPNLRLSFYLERLLTEHTPHYPKLIGAQWEEVIDILVRITAEDAAIFTQDIITFIEYIKRNEFDFREPRTGKILKQCIPPKSQPKSTTAGSSEGLINSHLRLLSALSRVHPEVVTAVISESEYAEFIQEALIPFNEQEFFEITLAEKLHAPASAEVCHLVNHGAALLPMTEPEESPAASASAAAPSRSLERGRKIAIYERDTEATLLQLQVPLKRTFTIERLYTIRRMLRNLQDYAENASNISSRISEYVAQAQGLCEAVRAEAPETHTQEVTGLLTKAANHQEICDALHAEGLLKPLITMLPIGDPKPDAIKHKEFIDELHRVTKTTSRIENKDLWEKLAEELIEKPTYTQYAFYDKRGNSGLKLLVKYGFFPKQLFQELDTTGTLTTEKKPIYYANIYDLNALISNIPTKLKQAEAALNRAITAREKTTALPRKLELRIDEIIERSTSNGKAQAESYAHIINLVHSYGKAADSEEQAKQIDNFALTVYFEQFAPAVKRGEQLAQIIEAIIK